MIIFKSKFYKVVSQKTRLKIIFTTKENLDALVLQQLVGTDGWLAFNEDEFKKEVEKAMAERHIAINEKGLSDSQILRGTLWKMWNKTDEKIEWDAFYHREMTKINEHYVTKYLKH